MCHPLFPCVCIVPVVMLSPQGEEEADSGAGGEFKSAAEMAKEEMGAALEAAADVPPASMVEVTLDGTMEVGEHAIESVEDEIERKVSPSPAQAGRRCSLWRGGVESRCIGGGKQKERRCCAALPSRHCLSHSCLRCSS